VWAPAFSPEPVSGGAGNFLTQKLLNPDGGQGVMLVTAQAASGSTCYFPARRALILRETIRRMLAPREMTFDHVEIGDKFKE
jgi:hypothetical protein